MENSTEVSDGLRQVSVEMCTDNQTSWLLRAVKGNPQGGGARAATSYTRTALSVPDGALDGSAVAHSLNHVACASLALGADHGCTLGHAAQGLPKITASTHEWDLEVVLVDVVNLISGCEYLHSIDSLAADRHTASAHHLLKRPGSTSGATAEILLMGVVF